MGAARVKESKHKGDELASVHRGRSGLWRALKVGSLIGVEVLAVGLPWELTGNAVMTSVSMVFVGLPVAVLSSLAIVNEISN
jgi:hypothetical protein